MKKIVFVSLGLMAVAIGAWFVLKPDTAEAPAATTNGSTATYKLSDVAKHSTRTDCWLVIENKVYDVTRFIAQHPGGDQILQGCGQDATNMFKTREGTTSEGTPHSAAATAQLQNYYIGDLNR